MLKWMGRSRRRAMPQFATMLMWGQPPSAVRSSEARLLAGNLHHRPKLADRLERMEAPRLLPANQLNPISKRIMNVTASHAGNIARLDNFNSRLAHPPQKIRIVAANQSRVGFLRRPELGFDSNMNPHVAALKPASAALGKFRRFRCFDHPEHALIKSARSIFFACGHGKLNMIDRKESWFAHAEILEEANKK